MTGFSSRDNLCLNPFDKTPPLRLKTCSVPTSFSPPVTIVMGIPTVKRNVKSYLSETLRSLIDKLSPEEKLDCVIIVYVGEVSMQVHAM